MEKRSNSDSRQNRVAREVTIEGLLRPKTTALELHRQIQALRSMPTDTNLIKKGHSSMRRLIGTMSILAAMSVPLSVNAGKRQTQNASNSHVERGIAAFYGRNMEGRKTACGSMYVASEMTAAHRTLPCGTKVRITNTKNGRSVEATVNDWGPTSRKRIVDVSRAVAERLDFVKQGTTTVEVEVVK